MAFNTPQSQYGYGTLGSEAQSSYSHGPPPPPSYGQGNPPKKMANTPPDYAIPEERQYIQNPDAANYHSPIFDNFDFSEKTIRRSFIRKVYSILMCQLIVTCCFIALFIYYEPVKIWTYRNPAFFYAMIALNLAMMIALACCANVRRHFPQNFICLGLFTLSEGCLLGAISSRYQTDTVMLAAGVTAVVCLSLTIFSFQTKWDFTTMGGILFVAMIVLMLFGFLSIFFYNKILSLVYACAGALLFSMYLVYDTQMMMGGKHRHSISPEEYIFASLTLYVDIIMIFTNILSIMGYANE